MVEEANSEPEASEGADRSTPRRAPVLGVCGGSGAGKTYLVRQIQSRCAAIGMRAAQVSFDAYYHDLQHLTPAQRSTVNFDHPDSLDGDLFARHVNRLATGEPIQVPLYDFSTHTRTADTASVGPADVIVLDGILLYAFESVRAGIDLSIYLDVPAGLRLDRRVARDTVERGRDVADVERQWKEFVEPMHAQFVEPFATSADVVVRYGEDRNDLLDHLMSRLLSLATDSASALAESPAHD